MSSDNDLLGKELLTDDVSLVVDDVKTNKLNGMEDTRGSIDDDDDDSPVVTKKKGPPTKVLAIAAGALFASFVAFRMLSGGGNEAAYIPIEEPGGETANVETTSEEGAPFGQQDWSELPAAQFTGGEPQAAHAETQPFTDTAPQTVGTPNDTTALQQPLQVNVGYSDARTDVESGVPVESISVRVDELERLLSEQALQLNALTELTARLEAGVETNKDQLKNGVASKRAVLDALGAIKALQAQDQRFISSIAQLKAGVKSESKAIQQENEQNTSDESEQRIAPAEQVVVVSAADKPKRVARELMWSSYIEDFGMAVIDGTTSLVELSPGQALLGRGVIKTITGTGCIVFTSGDKYAPTNGECL